MEDDNSGAPPFTPIKLDHDIFLNIFDGLKNALQEEKPDLWKVMEEVNKLISGLQQEKMLASISLTDELYNKLKSVVSDLDKATSKTEFNTDLSSRLSALDSILNKHSDKIDKQNDSIHNIEKVTVKSDVFTNELKDKDQKLEDLSRRVEKYAKYGIISLFSAVLLIVVFLYNINPLSQSNGSTKCCDQSECCKKYLCCEQTVENDSKKEN